MEIIEKTGDMQSASLAEKASGKKVCVVPTMGALHAGHLSLVERARSEADIVVTTLFVNPRQFAAGEDYGKYPRTFASDSAAASEAGSDYLFFPAAEEMYPGGFSTNISISGVTDKFEGASRPGHFDGVATVVAKLFNAVLPDKAVFGQKDYQQCLLITRLIKDLNFPIEMIIAPTMREKNGLAMSSRNAYLSADEKEEAAVIHRTLRHAEELIRSGERKKGVIDMAMAGMLGRSENIKTDYASAVVHGSMEEPEIFSKGGTVALLIAARLGSTRLIDNLIVEP